jgi:hypothetical protein
MLSTRAIHAHRQNFLKACPFYPHALALFTKICQRLPARRKMMRKAFPSSATFFIGVHLGTASRGNNLGCRLRPSSTKDAKESTGAIACSALLRKHRLEEKELGKPGGGAVFIA